MKRWDSVDMTWAVCVAVALTALVGLFWGEQRNLEGWRTGRREATELGEVKFNAYVKQVERMDRWRSKAAE
jgi:hypothetical protein